MARKFKTLDLFSGIGGFAYALKSVSKVVAYCEKSVDCHQVLEHNMSMNRIPRAKIFNDVQSLLAKELPKGITMITAGFPCQDISAANPKGKGIHGERSGLVKHVLRLVDDLPTVTHVFLENSPFIKTRGLDELTRMFASRDFTCKWTIVGCDEVGAPMQRKRWFFIATRNLGNNVRSFAKTIPIFQHNWKKEPVPRLVPRDSGYYENLHCLQMLGNSVVPQCVQSAFNSLVGEEFERVDPIVVNIELRDGKTIYKRHQWASPSLIWRRCVLSQRAARTLANQLFYDVKTHAQLPLQYRYHPHISKIYGINPLWVEWLMGYPKNYTNIIP